MKISNDFYYLSEIEEIIFILEKKGIYLELIELRRGVTL